MKPTTSTTIAALLVAAIAAGAALPALAQDQGPAPREGVADRGDGPGMKRLIERRGAGGPGGGFLALNCGPEASDRLEHTLLSLEQRTDPAGGQVALFEAFSAAASAAQAEFAEACATVRPAEGDTAARDLVDRLTTRLELDKARIAAMDGVLPAFQAFFASLSEEQKAALEPRRDGDGQRGLHRRGPGGLEAPAPAAPLNG